MARSVQTNTVLSYAREYIVKRNVVRALPRSRMGPHRQAHRSAISNHAIPPPALCQAHPTAKNNPPGVRNAHHSSPPEIIRNPFQGNK